MQAAERDSLPQLKRKRFGKNPNVDTSFLPDVERDEEENHLREQLRQASTIEESSGEMDDFGHD